MTVASLWKAIEAAKCGKPIGLHDLNQQSKEIQQGRNSKKPLCLAVDLSIWICEALTSTALTSFHANPVLYIVYQRTLKLIKAGIQLIFVVEGQKRRVRRTRINSNKNPITSEAEQYRNRRSGTKFWSACNSCQELLKNLGVTSIQAYAEGEALCALLNERGIVDGVISNDGDCFLYGAKVLYTGFSIESLESGQLMRYDISDLYAVVIDTKRDNEGTHSCNGNGGQEDDSHNKRKENENDESSLFYPAPTQQKVEQDTIPDFSTKIPLNRNDLIAFAMLTGSDLVGNGIPAVGYNKALKFISICQKLYKVDDSTTYNSAALDELKKWIAGEDRQISEEEVNTTSSSQRCCSNCLHPGNKTSHRKNGCKQCGTKPGEPCIEVSADERFIYSIRSKAKLMPVDDFKMDFIAEYLQPNLGKIPEIDTAWKMPEWKPIMGSSFIMKGHCLESSRQFLQSTLPKLIVRLMILRESQRKGPRNYYISSGASNDDKRGKPEEILKTVRHRLYPCYEIRWLVNGVHCSTMEWQSLIQDLFPQLVERFNKYTNRQQQQAAEEMSRRTFFGKQVNRNQQRKNTSQTRSRQYNVGGKVHRKKRERDFSGNKSDMTRKRPNVNSIMASYSQGDDASSLIKNVPNIPLFKLLMERDDSSIESIEEKENQKTETTVIEENECAKCVTCEQLPIIIDMGIQIIASPIVRRRKESKKK